MYQVQCTKYKVPCLRQAGRQAGKYQETRAKKQEISERPFYFFASLRLCANKKNISQSREDAKAYGWQELQKLNANLDTREIFPPACGGQAG